MALEREQVPANRKWRTEDIFATQEDWEALYGKVEAAVAEKPGFAAYQGKLTDAATVLECMEKLNAIMLNVIRLDVYAFMRGDEDTRKSEFVALKSRMSQLEMKLAAETAFITPELTSLPRRWRRSPPTRAFPITTTPCVCSSRKSRTSFHRRRRRFFRRAPACLTAAVRFSVCWTTPTSPSPPSR